MFLEEFERAIVHWKLVPQHVDFTYVAPVTAGQSNAALRFKIRKNQLKGGVDDKTSSNTVNPSAMRKAPARRRGRMPSLTA